MADPNAAQPPPADQKPPAGQTPPYGGQPPPGQPPYAGQPPYGGQPPPEQPPYAGQPPYGGQPSPGYGQPPPEQYYSQPDQPGMPMGMQPGVAGQPGGAPAAQWMPMPQGIHGCPPGLEYLTQIDQILVHQQIELFEMLTKFETANRYQIKNSLGQQVYFASEEGDQCQRQCCGPRRGFVLHITDNSQHEVMRVTREFKCCAGCCWCAGSDACAMEVCVEAPVGTVVGYVKQAFSAWPPRFTIQDVSKTDILKVEGPCCICQGICCTWDQDFNVTNMEETTTVGKVSKQWSGLLKEMYTQADNFGVTFPMDMDVKVKATMIGAVFLIDFMYFEQKQNNKNH